MLVDIGPTRVGSTLARTSRARSRSRPRRPPGVPFIELATIVSGPSWSRSSRSMTRWKRSTSNGSHLSFGSRSMSLTDSSVETLLMIAIRLMPSVPSRAARAMLTRLAICCAAWIARGSKLDAPGTSGPRRRRRSRAAGQAGRRFRRERSATNFLARLGAGGSLSRSESGVEEGRSRYGSPPRS